MTGGIGSLVFSNLFQQPKIEPMLKNNTTINNPEGSTLTIKDLEEETIYEITKSPMPDHLGTFVLLKRRLLINLNKFPSGGWCVETPALEYFAFKVAPIGLKINIELEQTK